MIMIEINRYTIMQLERAVEKWNSENNYRINEYHEMINKLLDEYVKIS